MTSVAQPICTLSDFLVRPNCPAKLMGLRLALGLVLLGTASAIEPPQQSLATEAAEVTSTPEDWPWWRGPTRDNHSSDLNPPLHWGVDQNVCWKVSIPGRGHASPTVCGNRIFIATADESEQIQRLLCLERQTGRKLWATDIHRGGFLRKHENNSHASATPACDGERVFFPSLFDDALWVTALNVDGSIVWQHKVGYFVSSNGYGSSPVVYRSMLIVVSDNVGDACLVALDRHTGEVVWKTPRPKLDNFCTPALGCVAGRTQLLLCGSRMLSGYDPANGRQLWFCESPTEVTACTMAFGTNLVVGSGNVPVRELMCARADGAGDVTATHIAWRTSKDVTYVPSPLIEQQRLYFVNDSGLAHCLDLVSGQEIWKERLGGDFFASPVLAAGHIYFTNRRGTTYVVRAADSFEVEAQNELGEECFASPVICGGHLFQRSAHTLYCVGSRVAVLSPEWGR